MKIASVSIQLTLLEYWSDTAKKRYKISSLSSVGSNRALQKIVMYRYLK